MVANRTTVCSPQRARGHRRDERWSLAESSCRPRGSIFHGGPGSRIMNQPSPSVSLSQIGQIAITVRNLDRAVEFYQSTLGMKLLFRVPNMAFFDCAGVR